MKMKAAVVRELNQLAIEEVELDPPKAGEVLVRIKAAGVCHSDLHTMRGELRAQPPIVLGHEGAGIVESIGDGVTRVKAGDRVMINWLPACESCPTCLAGHSSLCETFPSTTFQGLLPPSGESRLHAEDGTVLKHFLSAATMAEYSVVPEAGVIPIPDDVPFGVASIIGCAVMTGVGAVINTAQVLPGSSAALIGCGGVGLSILQGLRMSGAYPLIAIDVLDSKLDFATELGATHTINSRTGDLMKELHAIVPGGAEYVFDSVGRKETVAQAIHATAAYGSATVTGMHDALAEIPVPAGPLIFQNKKLLGSFVGSCRPQVDLPKLVELYRGGRLDIDALITKRYPLEEVNQAFADMEGGSVARGVLVFE